MLQPEDAVLLNKAPGGRERKLPPEIDSLSPNNEDNGWILYGGHLGHLVGVYADCVLDSVPVQALIDTGSNVSLLHGGLLGPSAHKR